MKIKLGHKYEDIVSVFNLLLAWEEFIEGKKNKKDVQDFQFHLMDNILSLHADLSNHLYRHGGYKEFNISDPKLRIIHKASVRDRLLHHAVYRMLYDYFDERFIFDSYSCRNNKGTHRAIRRFHYFNGIVSKNNTKTCWVLKCDIKKFFHSIDQKILIEILQKYIADTEVINLLTDILHSFYSKEYGRGLPLGNLTSQIFANIYMNEFDQFIKHKLKVKYFIRYADDFVIMSEDKKYLQNLIPQIGDFLQSKLNLQLHPEKIFIKTFSSGIDFLGWVNFSHHKIIRTKTKHRIFKRLRENESTETLNSYFGLLSHGNTAKIKSEIINLRIKNVS